MKVVPADGTFNSCSCARNLRLNRSNNNGALTMIGNRTKSGGRRSEILQPEVGSETKNGTIPYRLRPTTLSNNTARRNNLMPTLVDPAPTTTVTTLRGNYSGTDFEQNVLTNPTHNEAIGDALVKFIDDGMRLVICDGSSTAIFARRLFDSGKNNITIWTPSVAVALEFALARAENRNLEDWRLFMPQGEFDPVLLVIFGPDAARGIADESGRADLTIISVKTLLASDGPAGKESNSIDLKRHAVATANRIVWIADWRKLCSERSEGPKVYRPQNSWKEAAIDTRTEVIVTGPPEWTPQGDAGKSIPAVLSSDRDRFRANYQQLKNLMQGRLHFVDAT
jgi:DeoR/GlpR family transcriptional regulator of sugar metabolism